jgi:hypothetical protein
MEVGQLTCLLEAIHRFVDAKGDEVLAGFALSCLMKGRGERRDKTAGKKRLVYILRNWGEARGDSR